MIDKKTPCTILIIDDDPDDHFFVKNAIREAGAEINVISKYNGLQALELLNSTIVDHKNTLPDLIICDINMPLMNGIAFVEKIKARDTLKEIPIVIMSTACEEDTKAHLLSLGVLDCIAKPVYSENYRTLIAAILNNLSAFDDL